MREKATALSPAAALVRRFDPDLFHAALFAPEPARGRLLTLYAFDIELSRALSRASEPLLAQMRLEWWSQVARGETAPGGHEVAEPLAAAVSEGVLPAEGLAALAAARAAEIAAAAGEAMDRGAFAAWCGARFGGLTGLAARLLGGAPEAAVQAVGQALGAAFALRNALPMARANVFMLPGLAGEARALLARGETGDAAREAARVLAAAALEGLGALRAKAPPRAALPAFLPLWRARRVLRRAARPDFDFARDTAPERDDAFRALGYAWAMMRGRV